MGTLKPALALVTYSKNKTSVKSLTPVAADQCEPRCDLDDPDEWTIYTHMRANGEKYPEAENAFAQLVLMLEPGGGVQDAGRYQISVPSLGGGTSVKMVPYYHEPDETWYFVPPGSNDSVSSAGRQEILVEYTGEPNESRTIQVYILPSGIDDENYSLMLEEIAQLHQELLITAKTTGTVSVGQRWERVARDLERDMAQMQDILHQLERAPDQDLVAVQSRVPSYKVKKLTAKAVLDQEAGRRLVRTSLHMESLDIYEHRMIRAHLEKLRQQVLRYQKMEQQERSSLAGEEISQKDLDAVYKRLNAKLQQMTESIPLRPNNCQTFELQVTGIPGVRSNGFVSCFPPKAPGDTRKAVPVLNDRTTGRAANMGWFNSLVLCPGCGIWQYWFLYHCMSKLTQCWENSGQPSLTVTFSMSYTPVPISSYGDVKRYQVVIDYLDSMTLPGIPPIQFHEFTNSFQFVREADPSIRMARLIQCIKEGMLPADPRDDDNLFYGASLVDLTAHRSILLGEHCNWDRIAQQIDRLLTSPVLRARPHKGERLHASNLFANHRLYRRAYALLLKRQEQLLAIDLWTGRAIPVGATHHVYEIWCLLKMLSVWTRDYSFTLVSPNIGDLTAQLLRYREHGAIDPIHLERKSGPLRGMRLELEYDQIFHFIENGKQRELSPDYCLTIRCGGKAYRFFMDAKYHNYSEGNMGVGAWYDDLYGVALNKYIFRLGNTGVETCGSYILHPDAARHELGSGWDTRKFFWYRSDIRWSKTDPESVKVLNKFPGLLTGRDEDPDRSVVESLRFGAICFTPHTDAPFRGLMQMMMEHFLGKDFPDAYLKKCWICGSEDVDHKLRYTAAGNKKYHITCNNCKQFWVRTICAGVKCGRPLGKHLNNYYRIKLGTPWNVICPDCETDLEQAKKPESRCGPADNRWGEVAAAPVAEDPR